MSDSINLYAPYVPATPGSAADQAAAYIALRGSTSSNAAIRCAVLNNVYSCTVFHPEQSTADQMFLLGLVAKGDTSILLNDDFSVDYTQF